MINPSSTETIPCIIQSDPPNRNRAYIDHSYYMQRTDGSVIQMQQGKNKLKFSLMQSLPKKSEKMKEESYHIPRTVLPIFEQILTCNRQLSEKRNELKNCQPGNIPTTVVTAHYPMCGTCPTNEGYNTTYFQLNVNGEQKWIAYSMSPISGKLQPKFAASVPNSKEDVKFAFKIEIAQGPQISEKAVALILDILKLKGWKNDWQGQLPKNVTYMPERPMYPFEGRAPDSLFANYS
jgi:hypothetical protein